MKRSDALTRAESLREAYCAFVDANTRPRSRAAAAFTKRQAADLKAGYSDALTSLIGDLAVGGAFEPEVTK